MDYSLSEKPYPLLCVPHYVEKIWGGRRLEGFYGKQLPADRLIGESWEIADLPEGASAIENGPLKGWKLSEVVRRWGPDLNGEGWSPKRFPLLVKLIDANEDLSVQVHPSDQDCREKFPGHHGKDETWIVLDNRNGGGFFHGFKEGTTLKDFESSLKRGQVVEALHFARVKPGDAVRVAPGTAHALKAGVMILEIQQPSDSTFRIYDYDRRDTTGQPRPLHLEESKSVLRFNGAPRPFLKTRSRYFTWGKHEILVDCAAYRIERFEVKGRCAWSVDPLSVQCLVSLTEKGELSAGGETVHIAPGRCVILPANIGRISLTCQRPGMFVLAGASGLPLMTSGAAA